MGDPNETRKRLEALNRAPLPEDAAPKLDVDDLRRKLQKRTGKPPDARPKAARPAKPILYGRDAPVHEPRSPAPRVPPGPAVDLAHAVPGVEMYHPGGAKAYVIAVALTDLEGEWAPLCQLFEGAFACEDSPLWPHLACVCGPTAVRPHDLIFVDLETTGLTSSWPLFLIGTMAWEGGDFVIRQYLARDYAEEQAAIALFLDSVTDKRLLVTFNGKSFDRGYLRDRAAANRVPVTIDLPHLDLLHLSRRIWRRRLPDCKLQTLERLICHRVRCGDIPGAEIPDAYHAFVRTGNAAQIVAILKHNQRDLVTMADLMTRLPGQA